ncbi:unnamed protein product [Parascedosporium putredinis]|uniref:Uncharacterized protein n=1 Tax=Parascedosporium putredinis TaxID=1442378 RepID=A0A9P1MG43_9PEZI|nr:unnamed protein product [Parascedosporium putredinis]CAI8003744.1 unnamed protein product [Parascedosporium putredinis]
MGLNPLTTSIAPSYQQNVPLSAVTLSPNGQYPLQTPVSAIQPYNPQEWVASPMAGPERTHVYSLDQQPMLVEQPRPAARSRLQLQHGTGPNPNLDGGPPRRDNPPLTVDTSGIHSANQHEESSASCSSSAGTLSRTHASADQFMRETVDRFKLFAMREASAETDAERVRLFADLIVSESRIRRRFQLGATIGNPSRVITDARWDAYECQLGANGYMPSLSPILSMSNVDESDSRAFGEVKEGVQYMGVPKEAREALQWVDSPRRTDVHLSADSGSPSDYPPEKMGFADQEVLTPKTSGTPSSPSQQHHPAVNNNHPDLSDIRSVVRTISDLEGIKNTKERFHKESERRRQDLKKQAAERKQALRLNLQEEINSGNMSYADAAAIDAEATESEKDQVKEMEKVDFEQFQKQVVAPVNELLTSGIARSTQLLNDLASGLFHDGENAADTAQEEGDDKPELLEKLTLLKWIFEAREGLHKAIYDLLSDRNDRYKTVITTPYRLSGNDEKLRSAEAFSEKTRPSELVGLWDIAPNISRLLERIPSNLAGFRVQIPADEYEENPSYRDHPLQYLFSLVLHAEKSTYQFIESQTNLLCLLHEVREAVTHAKVKVIEAEVDEDGNPLPNGDRESRARQTKEAASQKLTEDLKEKVRVVQDQWTESLGEAIKHVKERVGGWLLETGGWDEQLEEDGVGVA